MDSLEKIFEKTIISNPFNYLSKNINDYVIYLKDELYGNKLSKEVKLCENDKISFRFVSKLK